jgi:hypothetical protein
MGILLIGLLWGAQRLAVILAVIDNIITEHRMDEPKGTQEDEKWNG